MTIIILLYYRALDYILFNLVIMEIKARIMSLQVTNSERLSYLPGVTQLKFKSRSNLNTVNRVKHWGSEIR